MIYLNENPVKSDTSILPYCSSLWNYLAHLASEIGLIVFHSGLNNQEGKAWLSCWPTKQLTYLGHSKTQITLHSGHKRMAKGDFFDQLKGEIPQRSHSGESGLFHSGLAGHISYDMGLELHNLASQHSKPHQELACVGVYHWSINVDHDQKTAHLFIHPDCPPAIKERVMLFAQALIKKKPNIDREIDTNRQTAPWQSMMSQAQYESAFNKVQSYIFNGDAYQINLTRPWSSDITNDSDWAAYKALSKAMPAPFSIFHRTEGHSLLSVSPERFLQIKNNKVMTQPIKGTRPRQANAADDAAMLNGLLNSDKDRAENLMIVDLLRNDLAKHAVAGSVEVTAMFEPHSFSNVHHLISTIEATLKKNTHPLDVFRDAFPGGSITGAPKKRAMEIIDELETSARGQYCGSAFYLNQDGDFDSNILIRSVTLTEKNACCSGGGGVVYDSEMDKEFDESEFKVKAILNAMSK